MSREQDTVNHMVNPGYGAKHSILANKISKKNCPRLFVIMKNLPLKVLNVFALISE